MSSTKFNEVPKFDSEQIEFEPQISIRRFDPESGSGGPQISQIRPVLFNYTVVAPLSSPLSLYGTMATQSAARTAQSLLLQLCIFALGTAQSMPYSQLWSSAPWPMPDPSLQSVYPLPSTLASAGALLFWMQAPLGRCVDYYDYPSSRSWTTDAAYNGSCLGYLDTFAVGDEDLQYGGGNPQLSIVGVSRNAGVAGAPCNGSGYFIYVSGGDCRSSGTTHTQNKNGYWAVSGPRSGAFLRSMSYNGWTLFGGTNASGYPMIDIWYTTNVIMGEQWYRGTDLPSACYNATSFKFTPFHARDALYLYCPSDDVTGAWDLYAFRTGYWSVVGTTMLPMDEVKVAAVLAPISDSERGRVDPRQQQQQHSDDRNLHLQQQQQQGPSGLSAPAPAASAPRLDPNLCFAAVSTNGSVYRTLDGITFFDTGAPAPSGPRLDFAFLPSSPGIAVVGGRTDASPGPSTWLGDLYKAGPQLCCITGFNTSKDAYELCNGHGDCTGTGSTLCVCTSGWSGAFCDIAPPPSPSSSRTPRPLPPPADGGGLTPALVAGIVLGATGGSTVLAWAGLLVWRRAAAAQRRREALLLPMGEEGR